MFWPKILKLCYCSLEPKKAALALRSILALAIAHWRLVSNKPKMDIIAYCSDERDLKIAERLLTDPTRQGPFVLGEIDNVADLLQEKIAFEIVRGNSDTCEEEDVRSANPIAVDEIVKGLPGRLVQQLPPAMVNSYIVEVDQPVHIIPVAELPSDQTETNNPGPMIQFDPRLTLEQAKAGSRLALVKRICLRRAAHKLDTVSLKLGPRQIRFSPATLYASADNWGWRERSSNKPDKPSLTPIPDTDRWTEKLAAFELKQPGHMESEPSINLPNKDDIYEALRLIGDTEGRNYLGTESLPRLIQALHNLTYEHVGRAKLIEHNERCGLEEGTAQPSKFPARPDYLPASPTSRPIWVQVIALCQTTINLCRSISTELVHLEYGWRVKIYMLNSLALGRLGRFTEARRCLNEANALLSKLPRRLDEVELAAIELRRGEVHLLEATFLARLLDELCEELFAKLPKKNPNCPSEARSRNRLGRKSAT
jgi:hypothetical protein